MGFFFIFDEEIFPQFKGNGEKKKIFFMCASHQFGYALCNKPLILQCIVYESAVLNTI